LWETTRMVAIRSEHYVNIDNVTSISYLR